MNYRYLLTVLINFEFLTHDCEINYYNYSVSFFGVYANRSFEENRFVDIFLRRLGMIDSNDDVTSGTVSVLIFSQLWVEI